MKQPVQGEEAILFQSAGSCEPQNSSLKALGVIPIWAVPAVSPAPAQPPTTRGWPERG